MHLHYSINDALDIGETRHAQDVMKELGITYQHATPQSMADSWWFWNCSNVPSPLPPFLRPLNLKPHEVIGYGLSKAMADAIETAKPES